MARFFSDPGTIVRFSPSGRRMVNTVDPAPSSILIVDYAAAETSGERMLAQSSRMVSRAGNIATGYNVQLNSASHFGRAAIWTDTGCQMVGVGFRPDELIRVRICLGTFQYRIILCEVHVGGLLSQELTCE